MCVNCRKYGGFNLRRDMFNNNSKNAKRIDSKLIPTESNNYISQQDSVNMLYLWVIFHVFTFISDQETCPELRLLGMQSIRTSYNKTCTCK